MPSAVSAALGENDAGDSFGQSIAVGDFNRDGYDDFAVGAPGDVGRSGSSKGAIYIFRGSATGITPWQRLDQGGMSDSDGGRLGLGWSLASGDFDGDGFDDLAAGSPTESSGDILESGAVYTYKGGPGGLSAWLRLDQEFKGPNGIALGGNETRDYFGWSLTVGDFDGNLKDDLAVGAPSESPGDQPNSGVVFLFDGTANWLVPRKVLDQRPLGGNESGDRFGESLAVGDFNHDDFHDLAVGAPLEAPGGDPSSGAVFVFHGSLGSLSPWKVLTQAGLDQNESDDQFGYSLAAGDLDGDRMDDLAVGAPRETLGNGPSSGFVYIFRGSSAGPTAWKGLGQAGLSANEEFDRFSIALTIGDFDGDALEDLAAGAPNIRYVYGIDTDPNSNPVFLFRGSKDGPRPWKWLDQAGLEMNELGDWFGVALASGDFNNDDRDDLAVGAHYDAPCTDPPSGVVYIYQGANNPTAWLPISQEM
ncbi:MAG: FG-GAP repeat protein [Myxococcaceae bacterium]|nr:FG-GAP repeat protein [Myxococcaceae bacterium]